MSDQLIDTFEADMSDGVCSSHHLSLSFYFLGSGCPKRKKKISETYQINGPIRA